MKEEATTRATRVHGERTDGVGEAHSGAAPPGSEESLYWLALGPGIWALHFLACYLTAAIFCAKAPDPNASLEPVRWLIVGYSAVALAGIALTAWYGLKRHRTGTATVPHDYDTPQDRHRFLGFATLLLAVLSGISVLYVAVVAFFFRSCA